VLDLLLLALAVVPTSPPSRLDAALLTAGDVAPECHLDSTQPLDPQGGAVQLSRAEAAVEQVISCNGDIGIVDYFDTGRQAEQGVKELQQARWGGPQPPARLHDGLVRKQAVLADVSGSRVIVFLLQTKLQARDFHSLGGTADFEAISKGMAEDRAERAPPISGRFDPGRAGGDRIDWLGHEEGLREAMTSHRPVCVYIYTTWCPHCRNFERVLKDPRVVDKSRSFVMVKLDEDKEKELAAKYAPDGHYFPRMLFLSSDGELDPSVTNESRGPHRYTTSENEPKRLLGAMDRALSKLGH
jgi:protein-disulfide reductase (glutathione)